MPTPLRIAYGRIFHEANAYSPISADLDAFRAFHWFEGEDLAAITAPHRMELEGYLRNAELSGFVHGCFLARDVETVPTLSALAVPGGKLRRAAFDALRDRLVEHLEAAGPVDGVYLAMHGSMRVEGMDEAPEPHLIAAARDATGAPVAVSYDLHANLLPSLVEAEVVQAFRANPHWDLHPTGFRVARSFVRALRGEVRPAHAFRKLPLVLGGGIGVTFFEPARSLYRELGRIARRREVMNASLTMVHPFNDAEDLGWAVHVTTDDDPALAGRLADRLADLAWRAGEVPIPERMQLDEALDRVRRRTGLARLGPSALVDMGDVVGTGCSGGSTELLRAFVGEPPGLRILVPLHDPRAVATLAGRVGEHAKVVLRGTEGMEQPALEVDARVIAETTGEFGRVVAIEHGDLLVAITERPPFIAHPRFWRELGADPRRADAIVMKSFFQYRIFHFGLCIQNLPVATDGPSSFDLLTSRRFRYPVRPNDAVDDWRPCARRYGAQPGPRPR